METYKISLVPGPVSVPREYREAYLNDYGSPDIEADFFALLQGNQEKLQKILKTKNSVVIMPGEGMLALWGALKSTVLPGDRVLVLSNGVFGRGFADMARSVGAEAEVMEAPEGEFLAPQLVGERLRAFRPGLVTAVHCETPSGLLNPIGEIAGLIKSSGALFCVDFVASACGAEVRVDDWGIDLGLLGSQKCLSLLPDLSILTVSEKAWQAADRAAYSGYDAILPWRNAIRDKEMPCTHNWHANAALRIALERLENGGLEESFRRHLEVAEYCRKRAREMGLALYAKSDKLASPTVTAIKVPEGWTWPELDAELRGRGMAAGGSYGELAGKVFRIGHMGTQADPDLVRAGMDVLEEVLEIKRK